jgi:hypothetical protein
MQPPVAAHAVLDPVGIGIRSIDVDLILAAAISKYVLSAAENQMWCTMNHEPNTPCSKLLLQVCAKLSMGEQFGLLIISVALAASRSTVGTAYLNLFRLSSIAFASGQPGLD